MAFLGSQQLAMQRSGFFGGNSSLVGASRPQRAAAPSSMVVQAGMIGPGKKWEHYTLTPNGKPVRIKMHIKSGDLVKVIAGKDKGKVGKIVTVNTKTGQAIVEGTNIKTKHVKPTPNDEEGGQIIKKEYPVHHSNLQHYSESAQVSSRIGYRMEEGKKVRFLKKTGEAIDK